MVGPITDVTQSTLLQKLHVLLPGIARRLSDASAWRGLRVSEPDGRFAYDRLLCRDNIVSRQPVERTYMVGVHRFERQRSPCRMHNHVYPMAVCVLGESGRTGEALYDMPWEHRLDGRVIARGSLLITAGQSYTLEPCLEVFHAVQSQRQHFSVTLTDITDPPARPNRLDVTPLTDAQTRQIRQQLSRVLSRRQSGLIR